MDDDAHALPGPPAVPVEGRVYRVRRKDAPRESFLAAYQDGWFWRLGHMLHPARVAVEAAEPRRQGGRRDGR